MTGFDGKDCREIDESDSLVAWETALLLHYLYLILFEFSGCTIKEVEQFFHENKTTKRSNEIFLSAPF